MAEAEVKTAPKGGLQVFVCAIDQTAPWRDDRLSWWGSTTSPRLVDSIRIKRLRGIFAGHWKGQAGSLIFAVERACKSA